MRKQCKRKHWSTAINPIQHAIEGASLTPDSILDKLRARELAAVEAFRTGDATLQEWADLTSMLNLCETMAKGGIGPEALEACKRAETALIDAGKRFETTKRMVITGQSLQAFRDLQRQCVSRGEYEKWINKTQQRIKSKAPGVRDMSTV